LLKDAIITSQKLNVATKEVKLWKVDFPLTGVNEEEKLDIINKCTNVNVNIGNELDGVELPTLSMSSNEFTEQQNLQHAHII
ncbi:7386_t:CDS:1, partial [Funneliformis geosporum]